MATRVTFNAKSLLKLIGATKDNLAEPHPALKKLHVYMMGQTDRTFRYLKRGGRYTNPALQKRQPCGQPLPTSIR